jgi:cation diffusion facilitator family transporter
VVGFNFLVESFHRIAGRQPAFYSTLAIVAVTVSVVSKEIMAQISIRVGRKTDSQSLVADGWHHRSDALSSLLILVGIVVAGRLWWTDGVLGIAVSLMIFYVTFEILKNAISPLLGEKPDRSMIDAIMNLSSRVTSYDLQVHDMKVHEYGHHRELTMHIYLPADMVLSEAHAIAHKFEMEIWKELSVRATVHVDPRD